jgi:hypothetical protein
VAPAARERPEAVAHKKGCFPVSKKQSTEFSDADRALVDTAYEWLDDPRSTAFFDLLEPYYRRSHELPATVIAELQKTGAPFDALTLACGALARMTAPGGPAPNPGSHCDMIELLFVLHRMARAETANAIDTVVAALSVNAPGGTS